MERLDDLKVTDVKAFKQQLAEFESKTDSLSSSELGYLQLLQGYNMTLSGDFNGAQKHLEFLLHQQLEPEILFRVKAMLINVQAITQNYRSAFTLLQEITQQLPDIDNVRAKEHGLSVIAYTYNQLEQFATAKFYAQMLLDIAVSERARCHANHHLLESLYGQSDWAMFHALLEPAIAHCLQFNEQVFANLIRIKQHSYLLSIGDVQKAETYYQTYKDGVHNIGYPLLIASAAALAARTAVKLGKIDTALSLADMALSHQDTNQFSLPLINTYTALSEAHEANQDYKSALYFQTKLRDALKANSDNRFAQQQAYYLARAEVDVKNQRITLLDKDNQVLVLQRDLYEQDAQQNRLLVLVLGAIVLLASVLAYRGMTGRYRFKKIAEYDQLTGISNRYHFNKQARLALQYCEQNAKPVAVILFDLDHFKQINDLHGHAAGDWALQAVVKTCRNFMRNNDVFGRIGGEEFAVLLPGCQTDKAALLAEICRDAIASIDCSDSGFDFVLTASFGVSGSGTSGYILKQLLSDADNAMYQAKATGRNTVMAFSN
ncbi:GGDEF domain-containing protein [Rheinheimera sp. FR7-31]|uniref:GGDEF domain-containing protein n=1 Tax=Rheinheimera fenheensis TaxID=3152295 RepID=UPI00325CB14D